MAETLKELHREGGTNVPALLFNLAAVAVGVATLVSGWPTAHPAWIVFVTIWLAYFQNCWTLIFHEDAHLTLYKARWHNVMNGTIVGTLLLVPFTAYRQVHIRHHNRMNSPEDWELWPYTDPAQSLGFRRVFAFFDVVLGLWTGPYIYGRIFYAKGTPLKDAALRGRIAREYMLMAAFWGSVIGLVAWNGWWGEFVLVYLVPAWLTGVFQTLRKFTEHLGLPASNAMAGARTVVAEGVVGQFAGWTSFHISQHGLHHKYPQMPHGNLRKAFHKLEADAHAGPVFPHYWAAVRDMLPHLLRPGIGVNAHVAPPPPVAAQQN